MATKELHIVALDVPFPPDYGAAIDMYSRCRILKAAGYAITLHCFEYGRGTTHDAALIADRVFYYSRKKSVTALLSRKPFIVHTRQSALLLERLLTNDAPILFEGQHTTFLLAHPALQDRQKMVRLHNIEWQYYAALARRTADPFRKAFFSLESRKLKRHEPMLRFADCLACLSYSDLAYYKELFPQTIYLPAAFERENTEAPVVSTAPFVLLHGNLSVPENNEAAEWLLQAVSNHPLPVPLIIAGKNPPAALQQKIAAAPGNVRLVANPSEAEMNRFIRETSAHLLISFQHSGIKLKLLRALDSGKPCIATPEMVAGTGLEPFCTIVTSGEAIQAALDPLPVLTEHQRAERAAFLEEEFGAGRTVAAVEYWLQARR